MIKQTEELKKYAVKFLQKVVLQEVEFYGNQKEKKEINYIFLRLHM